MTISERIFEKLKGLSMSQKEFSEKTGIKQSTISEWKKNHTNPTSDKIMIICKVLDVAPEWLLSGIEKKGERRSNVDWFIVDKDTELGFIISEYNSMDIDTRNRLLGYIDAFSKR